ANVSRNAEAPSFDANTFTSPETSNLKAQTGTTYELGTRGRRRHVAWDFTVYRSLLRNELQCLTTGPWSPCSVVNADRTIHQGVEAGLELALLGSVREPGDGVWLNAVYTYSDFRFDGDSRHGNNRLPGIPPHQLRAEVLYRTPDGFFAGPGVEWMPTGFHVDNANQFKVDSYALLGFRMGYDTGSGWSVYLEGRNLLDKRYISSTIVAGVAAADSALFSPGTGRSVHAGLRLRW